MPISNKSEIMTVDTEKGFSSIKINIYGQTSFNLIIQEVNTPTIFPFKTNVAFKYHFIMTRLQTQFIISLFLHINHNKSSCWCQSYPQLPFPFPPPASHNSLHWESKESKVLFLRTLVITLGSSHDRIACFIGLPSSNESRKFWRVTCAQLSNLLMMLLRFKTGMRLFSLNSQLIGVFP